MVDQAQNPRKDSEQLLGLKIWGLELESFMIWQLIGPFSKNNVSEQAKFL